MVGQAPYVVNAGLTYTLDAARRRRRRCCSTASASASHAAGGSRFRTSIEQPRNVLDFSLRQAIAPSRDAARSTSRTCSTRRTRCMQGTVTRESYRTGRTVNLGFQWTP